MRRLYKKALLVCTLALLAALGCSYASIPQPETLGLQDGDLIFQNKFSLQSPAIAAATGSHYTHVGMIYHKPDGYYVIDSTGWGGVDEHPFSHWVWRGLGNKFTVLRYPGLSEKQKEHIIANAKNYYGRSYNDYFSFADQAIYCSELPYLAYKEAAISIGTLQQVKELNVGNDFAKILIWTRWKGSPYCQEKGITYLECEKRILNQELITPASIAADKHMVRVYSNFESGVK